MTDSTSNDGLLKFHCPTCAVTFRAEPMQKSLPFCSDRCKMIDLNRWMNHEIGIPYDGGDDSEEVEPPKTEWIFEDDDA